MSNSSNAINDTVEAFIKALALSGHSIDHSQFEINDLKAPHEPKSLPRGRMAVYLFMYGDVAYKIGKVGPKSNTRFQTQHYSAAISNSNLAKSLLDDESGPCSTLSATEVGDWIKKNLRRIDILLDAKMDISILNFLEAFLHCRYAPKYEGFKSQAEFGALQ